MLGIGNNCVFWGSIPFFGMNGIVFRLFFSRQQNEWNEQEDSLGFIGIRDI